MIELKNVSLAYIKEYNTLMNVNLDIDRSTLIVGNINDGTHTLMRILAKIDKDYSGEILIDGKNLREVKDKDLSVAYIPHEPYLFNHRSVFYNLYYPLKIRKINKLEAKSIINPYIEKYLSNFPTKIKDMSTSEKKIITLLRAMIRQPKYVIIEDLFVDLDNSLIELANEMIKKISKNSIIIACEPNENNYLTFDKFTLSYGKLTKNL